MNEVTSVLLIDDHQLLREGIKQIIESDRSFKVITESNGDELFIKRMEKHTPDIVIMDINLQSLNWREVVKGIKNDFPKTRIIVLTFSEEEMGVIDAIQLGVRGYLLKSMDSKSLIEAIQHISKGGTYIHHRVIQYMIKDYHQLIDNNEFNYLKVTYEKPLHILSRRECQVLQLLADGNSNKAIARLLGISQSTCKNHVNSILKKMNVNGRTHAVVTAIRNGWVTLVAKPPSLSS